MEGFDYGGISNFGYQREINEDYIGLIELDDDTLFAIVADGAGSGRSEYQPAALIVQEIQNSVKRIFEANKELFLSETSLFLSEAINNANRVIGAFKLGNEEIYGGFAASVTCCIITRNGRITFAHAGNTRLYLIRTINDNGVIKQLTTDHSELQKRVNAGEISEDEYYTHPDRLKLYSGIGFVTEPEIQVFTGKIKKNDILLITSDGIHNAIRKQAIRDIVCSSDNCKLAAEALVNTAVELKYVDNMSSIVIWIH